MPFASVNEIPQNFAGLPERGKRIAMHILNVLEEMGLTGPAAALKTENMLTQLFAKTPGGWGPLKTASVIQKLENIQKIAFNDNLTKIAVGGGMMGAFKSSLGGPIGIGLTLGGLYMGHKALQEEGGAPLPGSMKVQSNIYKRPAGLGAGESFAEIKAPTVTAVDKNLQPKAASRLDKAADLVALTYYGDKIAAYAGFQVGANLMHKIASETRIPLFEKVALNFEKSYAHIPTASGNVLSRIMGNVGYVGAAVAALTGASKLYDWMKGDTHFSNMMERFPDLAGEDQQKVTDFYGLLHTYAPALSANPLIAGNFVKQMLNLPEGSITPSITNELIGQQLNVAKTNVQNWGDKTPHGAILQAAVAPEVVRGVQDILNNLGILGGGSDLAY